jgi:hypothetical protein
MTKYLVSAALASAMLFGCNYDANAGAWTLDKGQTNSFTSGYYTFPYTYKSELSNDDGSGNILSGTIKNRQSYWGISERLEYGFRPGLTVFGDLAISRYEDRISITASENATPSGKVVETVDYYVLSPSLGARKSIYRDDYNAVSVEGTVYPGDIVAHNKFDHIGKTFAVGASVLYGRAFNIPFGSKDRPSYGNYIDTELGYKFYPGGTHHEINLNGVVGIRPIKNYTFGVGLYNTFNGFNYTDRPFNMNTLDAKIDTLTASTGNKDYMKSEVRKSVKEGTTSSYHQINFKVGYDISPDKTIYIDSFHNVFKDKAFTYNTVYLSLDWTF